MLSCRPEAQRLGVTAGRAGRQAGKLSHSRFRVPLSQDRRLEIRNSPFPGHLSELRENPPAPLGSALSPELQIPSHREEDYSSQSALRCSRRGRAKMAAGEEEGSVVEPEQEQEPAVEEPRSFKDLVRLGQSRFCPRCSLPCPADQAGGAPRQPRARGADTCGAPRAAVPGPGRSCGHSGAAPPGLALLLPSPLRGPPPLSAVVLTCHGVFCFPWSWDTS